MVFAGVIEIKSVSVDRYGRRVTLVYSVMRYLNAERAGRDVHLWRASKTWSGQVTARVYPTSPAPGSMLPGYHKTLEPVKGREAWSMPKPVAPWEFRGRKAIRYSAETEKGFDAIQLFGSSEWATGLLPSALPGAS